MQRGFTKLFNTIVTSTIWQEDDKTRIVWITMLAIADAFGNVFAAIPGLASVANVSIEAAEKAVTNLLAPDPYSRTKDFEGRRIEVIDGGWHILNYGKYRKMMDEEERREYKAKWAREKRRQKRTNVDKDGQAETPSRQSGHRQRQSTEVLPPNPLKGEVPNVLKEIEGFEKEWEAFGEMRKAKRAKLTPRASELILSRLSERPQDALSALQIAIVQNWTGFQWEWYEKQKWTAGYNGHQRQMSAFEIEKRIQAIGTEINTIFKKNGNKRVPLDGIDNLKQRRDELQKQLVT